MNAFKGCTIGSGTSIEAGCKLRRSVISNGCKIGKNVELANAIIMEGAILEDNCKVLDSIVGASTIIRANSTLNNCQLAMGCHVEKESHCEGQIILPLQDKHL